MHIFLARQPVFNANLKVVAYELLYRATEVNTAYPIMDADTATSQVIVNAVIGMGLEKITGGLPALINVTKSFLLSGNLPGSILKSVILEILETEVVDDALVASVKELASKGCRFALDDFQFHDSWVPLFKYADLIKIDVLALKQEGVKSLIEKLASLGVSARLLAEKIETQEEFEFYKALGFEWFQGYFLERPSMMKEKELPFSKLVALHLVGELNKLNPNIKILEELIIQDPQLTMKLLKVVNSASFGVSRRIDSIKQAVAALGMHELKCWVQLLSLSSVSDKPQELFIKAIHRAKFCQMIAEASKTADPDACFTAGLISMMPALMDVSRVCLLSQLPLSQELEGALLSFEGEVGSILKTVIDYELGFWDNLCFRDLSCAELAAFYLSSLDWVHTTNLIISS